MAEIKTLYLNQAATYLEGYKGEETIRSVAERANVSHSVVGALFARRSLPKAEYLLRVGQALGANIVTLMQLAGYLPNANPLSSQGISDPELLAALERLSELPPDLQGTAIEAVGNLVNSFAQVAEQRSAETQRVTAEDMRRANETYGPAITERQRRREEQEEQEENSEV